MPKPNMYQSLHTTVIGPYGERVEIQIRTHEMDRVAKSGIAAHWSYKEGGKGDETISRQFAWIQNLVENQADYGDPEEFLEKRPGSTFFPMRSTFSPPRGRSSPCPRGPRRSDFAYLIHTEVGNQCVGAKVNGRMVPLKTPGQHRRHHRDRHRQGAPGPARTG